MKLIRSGLGLPAENTRDRLQQPLPPVPAAPQHVPVVQTPVPEAPAKKRAKSKVRKRGGKKRRPRDRGALMLYGGVGVIVIALAVFAGLKVRSIRLDQEVQHALKDAEKKASRDTFGELRRALLSASSVVKVKHEPAALGAEARYAAALASEYDYELDRAKQLVGALGANETVHAVIAKVDLALAERDLDSANKHIDALLKAYPERDADANYYRGRIALIGEEFGAAKDAFKLSLRKRRPRAYLGMAAVQLANGKLEDALASADSAINLIETHPGGTVMRARILAALGRADDKSVAKSLERIIAEGQKDFSEQDLGVALSEVGWAAAVLALYEIKGGRVAGVKEALALADKPAAQGNPLFDDVMAEVYLATGEVDKARAQAEKSVEKWPKRVAPRLTLATLALAQGNSKRALESLANIGDMAGNATALSLRGRARLAAGMIDKAIADLDAALKLNPNSRATIVARAEVDLAKGDGRAVVKRIKDLFEGEGKSDAAVAVVYAGALRQLGDLEEAAGILSQIAREARSGRAFLELARLEMARNDVNKAKETYAKVFEVEPDNVEARIELSLLDVAEGRLIETNIAVKKLAGKRKHDGRVQVLAAQLATMVGDYARADEHLRAAEQGDGAAWLVSRERGRLALRKGSKSAAAKHLAKAAKEAPRDEETRFLQLMAADTTNIGTVAASVTQAFPDSLLAKLASGLVADAAGKGTEAARSLNNAARAVKGSARMRSQIQVLAGRALLRGGDHQGARKSANTAIVTDASSGAAHLLLGEALFNLELFAEAAAAFSRATELDPDGLPRAWFFLGDVLEVQGKRKEARKALQEYKKRFPEGKDTAAVNRLLKALK
jgi:tetratricopeptide (TPR) repeat protein